MKNDSKELTDNFTEVDVAKALERIKTNRRGFLSGTARYVGAAAVATFGVSLFSEFAKAQQQALLPEFAKAQQQAQQQAQEQCLLHFFGGSYPVDLNVFLSAKNVSNMGIPATEEQIDRGRLEASIASKCQISYIELGREWPGGTRDPEGNSFLGDQKSYDPSKEFAKIGFGYRFNFGEKKVVYFRPAIEAEHQFLRASASPDSKKVTNEVYRAILELGTPLVLSRVTHMVDPEKSGSDPDIPETYDRNQGTFTKIEVIHSLPKETLWEGANLAFMLGTYRVNSWKPLPNVDPVSGTLGDFFGVGLEQYWGKTRFNFTLLSYSPDIEIMHPATGNTIYKPESGTNFLMTVNVPLSR